MGINQFNVIEEGDVVEELNVPAPIAMTVISVIPYQVTCKWFEGTSLHHGPFKPTDLRIIRKKPRD